MKITKTITKYINDYVTSINVVNIEKQAQISLCKNIFKNCVLIGNIAYNIHPIAVRDQFISKILLCLLS